MQVGRSFWLETVSWPAATPLPEDLRLDVAVVGGGFAGLSTAWQIKVKAPSLRVAVLEAERIGHGASARNAGFAMTLFGLALPLTVLRFGKARAREAHEFMERAVDYVGELATQHGVDCDYEKNGLLTVATRPAHVRRLQGEVRQAGMLGMSGIEWLDESETKRRVSAPYLGARWEPQCALVNPAKLLRGLYDLATSAGVEIYEGAAVRDIVVGDPVALRCDGAAIRADRVVLAANAWSARLHGTRSLQFPVHTYIALSEPLAEGTLHWPGREGIEDGRNLIHYYRMTADNRLLMGGGDAYYYYGGGLDDHAPRPDTAADLEANARAVFPALKEARFTHSWGGPVSVPLDFAPAMGYLRGDRRVIYALGCVGHGVSLMTTAGRVLSDLALDRSSELTEVFFVNRGVPPMPPEPLRWVMAQGIRGLLKFLDYLDG